jgi:glycerol kinase
VVRALLEAICFQSREVLEAMMLDTAMHRASSLARGLSAALDDEQQQQQQQEPAAGLSNGNSSLVVAAAAAADLAPQGEEEPAAAVANGDSSGKQKQQQGAAFSATLNVLRVDGGASHNDLLMQLQVRLCGCEIVLCCGCTAGMHPHITHFFCSTAHL